ncbi:MAG: glycosyl hydrolase family 15 [Solirubrobacterales bacterium]|jgi:GH15 family glucan-1,4-alpha-glucosidase|nr:glycosyl hydrolase family 15 [Solirubrobacterales bacterium]
MKIEDYALIGDLRTSALVGRDGSIDWLCLPNTDSAACFAALLGSHEHGRWLVCPSMAVSETSRRYREGTLVLETDFETDAGAVRLIDFMPLRDGGAPQLVRIVEGLRGEVPMLMECVARFDYGSLAPWVEPTADGILALGGANALHLSSTLDMHIEEAAIRATFTVREGTRERLSLSWFPSHEAAPTVEDPDSALARTGAYWREWSSRCTYTGEWREPVLRSLITLKALTDQVTGAVAAAPTTSLPEDLGGTRNWDYRYCWLRDSVLTLDALLETGYSGEALAFGRWALRAWAGDPANVQIMYGLEGQRHLDERELDWLPGYEGSRPVRVGNAAAKQFQLDVFGEVAGVAYATSMMTGGFDPQAWPRVRVLLEYLEQVWRQPDDGIWEVRGPRRHFVQSKVMAWLAFDSAVRLAEHHELEAPLKRWRKARGEIHRQVCERGYDAERRTFTQYYGSQELDAAVLMIPIVGFLPGTDSRVTGTIDAIREELGHDGFVSRYSTTATDDGLPGSEGQFLACSFWLVTALAMNGRAREARRLFERLLALGNDLGLFSEEYDVAKRRLIGNFPQAFTHLTLVQAANTLGMPAGSVADRYVPADSAP